MDSGIKHLLAERLDDFIGSAGAPVTFVKVEATSQSDLPRNRSYTETKITVPALIEGRNYDSTTTPVGTTPASRFRLYITERDAQTVSGSRFVELGTIRYKISVLEPFLHDDVVTAYVCEVEL